MNDVWLREGAGSIDYSSWLATGNYPQTKALITHKKDRTKEQKYTEDWSIELNDSKFSRKDKNRYQWTLVASRPFKSEEELPLRLGQDVKIMVVVKMYGKYHYSHFNPITTWKVSAGSMAGATVFAAALPIYTLLTLY